MILNAHNWKEGHVPSSTLFGGWDLGDADFRGADLRCSDFLRADLDGAKFRKADSFIGARAISWPRTHAKWAVAMFNGFRWPLLTTG